MAVLQTPTKINSQTAAPHSPDGDAILSNSSKLGPATGGRFYKEDKQRPSLIIRFCPDPSRPHSLRCQNWVAVLEVKCFDVPRLMREGFHWNASNVINEDGYIEFGKKWPVVKLWTSTSKRWYFLADNHQPRCWIASLMVEASDVSILYGFNLSLLSPEIVSSASALNQDHQEIYGYEARTLPAKLCNATKTPMWAFNMIYGDMPMEGFWPWPRKEHMAEKNRDDKDAKGTVAPRWSQTRTYQNTGHSGLGQVNFDPMLWVPSMAFIALFGTWFFGLYMIYTLL
ncbi:hypothetical protein RRF57_012183 [Xylaria bambusicola]|uniref:Uncharacterized protein n=1 Tax=Xylaria bambusicola TaxID=326684 RepID=A0AAN7ZDH5_9PEZI